MNSASTEIRVSTQPTFSAYVRFILWMMFRQARFLAVLAIFGLIAFLLSPIVPHEQQGAAARYRASLGLLILPGIVFVLLPLVSYYTARKRWQTATELRAPRTYVFSDSGLEVIADTFKSQVAWTHVPTAYKNRDQVLLGGAQQQFYLVPVRDFESPEQFARFLELLKRNVADCRF